MFSRSSQNEKWGRLLHFFDVHFCSSKVFETKHVRKFPSLQKYFFGFPESGADHQQSNRQRGGRHATSGEERLRKREKQIAPSPLRGLVRNDPEPFVLQGKQAG